jgi:hypothetical protein
LTHTQIVNRFARGEVAWLERELRRALEDNPEGQALLLTAVERAVLLGMRGWGSTDAEGRAADDLWGRWQARRQLTPEAERWPELLGEAGGREAERTLAEAEALLLNVGAELGMTGAVGGRRARRTLADVGRQSAEAGASLAYVLTAPRPAAAPAAPPPRAVPAEPMRIQQVKNAVKVATTGNLAECELLQGMLADAGIPSSWRRAGMDIPELLAAGDRDIFVPPAAAEEARVVLAVVTDASPGVDGR